MLGDIMQSDLFQMDKPIPDLPDGVAFLSDFALENAGELVGELNGVLSKSPFRNMKTPGGHTMGVAMTNCGTHGWVSDRSGYKYTRDDPMIEKPWPEMPGVFQALASEAAAKAGFPNFKPDACLVNKYLPGTKLSLHQDKDEADFSQPIVSVSLGLPATFELGGMARKDPKQLIAMSHGDVLVWGGPSRMRFHGVRMVKSGVHDLLGACRINLTFRKAV